MNLIRNAGEAMAEQPEEERRLTIAAEPDKDGNLEVAVSDNGPSAVAAELEGMFRPFHTSKAEGMGMGLAICRTIVESHHGRIWAEANGHRGISVHFTLPKA